MKSDKCAQFEQIANEAFEQLVRDIVNVQPMPNDILRKMYEASTQEKELIQQGYVPVDPHIKLTWVKR